MVILSHRGYWKAAVEKNTRVAFQRSFELGFGTETDLRDFGGKLVISHDPPTADSLLFEDFLSLYQERGNGLPLALNVKSDGLQESAKELSEPPARVLTETTIPSVTEHTTRSFEPIYVERKSE